MTRSRWAHRRQIWGPAAILVLALAFRVTYLCEIKDLGFFRQAVSDGAVYEQRAAGIAEGDWLGPADFVHAPLYAYVLGAVRWLAGSGPWAPRCLQILLGAASCVLLYSACRRFFDSRAAIVAGLLLAIYPPAIFFDGLIQKTSLAGFLDVLLLWLLACSQGKADWRRWGATGAVLGLLILTRQNALALAPLVLAWLWISMPRQASSGRAACTVTCAVGLIVVLLPWAARNRVVTGEFVLTTPNLGQNFAMGNNPKATGTYLPFKRSRSTGEHEQQEWTRAAEKATGRTLSPREVSAYYFNSAVEYIKANPGAWLSLTTKKCLMTWNSYEAPDTEDYYLYKEHSALLRAGDTVWHFGALCPIAIAGILLTIGRFRSLWPLYAWLTITTLSVAAFVVFARYRMPLVPVLMMFAGAGIVAAAALLRAGRGKRLVWAALAAALAGVVANWTVHLERRPYSFSYVNHAVALADAHRFDEALRQIQLAYAIRPDDVDALMVEASVFLDMGRYDEALARYQRAVAGDPQYGGAYRGMGDALAALGQYAAAAEQYHRALQLDPDDYKSMNGLASTAARQGRFAAALDLLNRVLAIAPQYPEAYLNLGNTYLAAGRLDDAVRAYEQALRYRADYADALYNLGVIEANQGKLEQAVTRFRKVLSIQPDHRAAQQSLAAALIQAGRADEAAEFIRRILSTDPTREDMRGLLREMSASRRASP
jgi:tetratricopeptide (TPR) repeat protein